jgi:1-deoxy-D-xylulose-5-phosphate synthase
MAGGLAKQGMIPVVALYSTFLQRSYDMLLQDICMQKLHVVFAVDRAGLVGEDGETHHGIYDVGFLRHCPGLRILCPGSMAEQQAMLRWAVLEQNGPVAIRYPRGGNRAYSDSAWNHSEKQVCVHREGSDCTIITYGTLIQNAMDAAEILAQKGIEAQVLRLMSIAPIPVEELTERIPAGSHVIVVEEVSGSCAVQAELAWLLARRVPGIRVDGLHLGNGYVQHGAVDKLYEHYGLSSEAIARFIQEVHQNEN